MAKIIGNTTATTSPQSDYNQTDSTKADYIKNKPTLGTLASKSIVEKSDVASDIQDSLNKADTSIQSLEGYATEGYVNLQVAENNLTVDDDDAGNVTFSSVGPTVTVVESISGTEVALTLESNKEYHLSDAVTSLTVSGFAEGESGIANIWSLVFTAGDSITVSIPAALTWAVAEPVFTAGSTYWISVVPMGDKYLAVWTEVTADAEETS